MNPYLNINIDASSLSYLYKYGILRGFWPEFEISKPIITVKLKPIPSLVGLRSCHLLIYLNEEPLRVEIQSSKHLKLETNHIIDWGTDSTPRMDYFRMAEPVSIAISKAFRIISENTTAEFVSFLEEIENSVTDAFNEWAPIPNLKDIETVLLIDSLDHLYELSSDKLGKDRLNWMDIPLLEPSIVQKVLIIYQPLPEYTPIYISYGIYINDNIVYFAPSFGLSVFTDYIELLKVSRIEWLRKNCVRLEQFEEHIRDILDEYDLKFISYLDRVVERLQEKLEKEKLHRSIVLEP